MTGFSEGQLETLCFRRHDGVLRWKQRVQPGKIESGARLGNPATATPVTDGERVYAYFGSFGLLCYDFNGREIWRQPLPVPVTQHGAGTSPVLAGGRVLLNCDQDLGSFLIALDKETGCVLWKTPRPEFRRGFSTPLLWPASEPQLVIVAGTLQLVAYRVEDGVERWRVRGLPNEIVASPVAGDGLIFAAGWTPGSGSSRLPTFDALLEAGDRDHNGTLTRDEAPPGPAKQHFLYFDANKDGQMTRAEWDSIARIFTQSENALIALKPGGQGDVTATHVLWRQTRGLPYCPSPLYFEGHVYLVKNGGLVSCFDAKTGRQFYLEERVGALGDYYASPIAAHGKVCLFSHPGVGVILQSGDSLTVLARNPLGESVAATPAIAGGVLYVRTEKSLFAFGEHPDLLLPSSAGPAE